MQPHGLKVFLEDKERGFPIRVGDSKASITMLALRSALDQELEEAFEVNQDEERDSVLPLL